MPADTPPETLIELDHATVVRDGVPVLHDVSLSIELGQHSVILGPNGCGKSSFVQLISRNLYPLARPDGSAPVRIFGQARWDVAQLRSRLGVVSADLSVELARLRGLDVEDTVASGFWGTHGIPPHRTPDSAMLRRSLRMLERMQIGHLRHRRLATLSAGETRRVLIARALVHEPRALLLDEPTTGLDIAARQQLLDTLQQLARDGVTLVLVTHHIEEVLPEIGQAILLRKGRVFASGRPDAVLTDSGLSRLFGLPLRMGRSRDGWHHLLPAS